MRGWKLVGHVDNDGYVSKSLPVSDDAILAFASDYDGVMREGFVRARDAKGRLHYVIARLGCPLVSYNDEIYVAVALGEEAFTAPEVDDAPRD